MCINQFLYLSSFQKSISTCTVPAPKIRINEHRMASSLQSLLLYFGSGLPSFSVGIWLNVNSAGYYITEREGSLALQEALLFVLHPCPAFPKGANGVGLTVQHIIFLLNCWVNVPYATNPTLPHCPLYLTQSSTLPPPYLCMPRESGPGGRLRVHIPFHLARWAVNTVQHQEQQVLSLPIINYPGCIPLGSLTPEIQISITCTILFPEPQTLLHFSLLEVQPSQILSVSPALQKSHFFSAIVN